MRFHFFKPSPKTVERAHRLARFAHHDWVNAFFFLLCLAESFVMFIPADTLISVVTNVVPEKKRRWFVASLLGYCLGFVLIVLLIDTSFKGWLLNLIHHYGYYGHLEALSSNLSRYGFLGLIVSVLAGFPPLACILAALIIQLNPWSVLLVTLAAKTVRIWGLIWIVGKAWSTVIRIRHKIEEHKTEETPSKRNSKQEKL